MIAVVGSVAAVVLSTYFAISVDRFGWEVEFTLWTQRLDLGPVRFVRGWLFWMGGMGVAGVALAVASAILWFRSYRIEAAFVALTAIPNSLNFAVREALGRARPGIDLVEVMGGPQGFSFPSGHALHVLFFYGFLLYLAAVLLPHRRRFWAMMVAGAIYIPLTGLWLIYDGRHWFSDVLGGYVCGLCYLLIWIAAYQWAKRQVHVKRRFRFLHGVLLVNRRAPGA